MRTRVKKIVSMGLSFLLAVTVIFLLPIWSANDVMASETKKIPAFPGAEGGGMYASGGRGYDVYVVTNLKDYTKDETPISGSLRYGLKSNRTIVFQVAGNIALKRSLRFDYLENLTIAGQTAPGDGITLSGYDTNISRSKNTIIRYIRFRPGAANIYNGGDSMDAMWGRDNNTFIIDHCSLSWNTDECLSLYRGENGTVQWCLIYESLTLSGHTKGRHGYGGISGGNAVTFHHNLYADHTSRNPRIGGGYAGKADSENAGVVELSNNLTYNWGYYPLYGGGYEFTNFINNYQLAGPGTRDNIKDIVVVPGEGGEVGGFHVSGNYIADYTDRENGVQTGVLDYDSPYILFHGDLNGDTATAMNQKRYLSAENIGPSAGITNTGFDSYEADHTLSVYDEVLDKAGAIYPRRDAIDARIVSEVKKGLGRYINTEHEVGGYVSEPGVITSKRDGDFDKDGDGMADAWELEHGLDPNDPADRNFVNADGYTNLEVYLNSLVDMEQKAENPAVAIENPQNNQFLSEGDAVNITAQAYSNYGHKIKKIDFYFGTTDTKTTLIGSVAADKTNTNTYGVTVNGLTDGTYFLSARVYDDEGNQTQATAVPIHVNKDPSSLTEQGWHSVDIGHAGIAGTANSSNGVLTVKGNGKLGKEEGSLPGTDAADPSKDAFHFVYKEITGDAKVTAKLESIASVDNHAFSGIMIREDLSDHGATAALGLSWVKYTHLPWSMYLTGRDKKGGAFDLLAEDLDSQAAAAKKGIALQPDIPFKNKGVSLGYFMKLVRKGNTFSAYSSADGENWKLIGERTVEMKETVYAGFAVDSNKVANEIEQLNTARFSNVQIIQD